MADMKKRMEEFKKSSLQAKMAVASFVSGVGIACVCLFFIEPIGEIATSAISIVSELLVLAGALLGVKASFDHKQQVFAAEMAERISEIEKKQNNN